MKATVVSIVPFAITEIKPAIYPGTFRIPAAASDKEPQILHIGDSVYYVEVDEKRKIQVKQPAPDIAKSIVYDYLISNIGYSIKKNSSPGLFWIEGQRSIEEVLTNYEVQLDHARKCQFNWFKSLVQMADDDWERTRQHKTISDTQRYAARNLNLERPWIIEASEARVENTICPACANNIPSTAIVCMGCRCIINIEAYNSLQFAGSPTLTQQNVPQKENEGGIIHVGNTPLALEQDIETLKS